MGDVLDLLEHDVQNHSREIMSMAAVGGVASSPKANRKSRSSNRKRISRSQSCFSGRKEADELGVSSHHSTVSSSSSSNNGRNSSARISRRVGKGEGGSGAGAGGRRRRRRRHTTGNFNVDEVDSLESNHSPVSSSSRRRVRRSSSSFVRRSTSSTITTPPNSPGFSSPPTSARSVHSIGIKADVFGLDPMDIDIWDD